MKLSVITVNLNNAIGLEKTIHSVINQNLKDFEFIIIDGGSTDESLRIINKNEKKISYWISEPDKGIYNAMNKGIKKAVGEYCFFLNSGDCLHDEYVLEKVFSYSGNEQILYGNALIFKNGKEQLKDYPDEKKITFRYLTKSIICHQSMFFKKSLFDLYGFFNEKLKYAADWEFYLLAIARYNVSIHKINIPISKFDLTGISNDLDNWPEMLIEREAILKRHFGLFMPDYYRTERLEQSPAVKIYRLLKSIALLPVGLASNLKRIIKH
jgi:glycosyltransferase involved in cell wall biosynthesis